MMVGGTDCILSGTECDVDGDRLEFFPIYNQSPVSNEIRNRSVRYQKVGDKKLKKVNRLVQLNGISLYDRNSAYTENLFDRSSVGRLPLPVTRVRNRASNQI